MRIVLLLVLCSLSGQVDSKGYEFRYKVESFWCYYAPLSFITEDGVQVSSLYGSGIIPIEELHRVAAKWNKKGRDPKDEAEMQKRIQRRILESLRK